MTEKKCPHCLVGRLKKGDGRVEDYLCVGRCGRGWKVDAQGNWHALFDAGNHVYNPQGVLIEALGRPILARRRTP